MEIEKAQAQVPATMPEKLAWLSAIHQDSELTYAQKCVAFALFRHHNQGTGRCNPSQEQIGAAVGGMSRQAVNGALKALKAGGWVSSVPTRGHSYYQLRIERAGAQVPAELSGSNDNSVEGSGLRSQNFMTPGVRFSGQQESDFPDTEPSTSNHPIQPSISPTPPAEANGSAAHRTGASGRTIERRETTPARPQWTDIPADWQPDETCRTLALAAGVRAADLQSVVAEFVAYQRGNGRRSPEWSAKWQSWCQRHVEYRNAREARQQQAAKPKKSRHQW